MVKTVGWVVLKLYLIVLPMLLAVYHHDTLVPLWYGLCPPLKAHLLPLSWYLWWEILNCVICPARTMPFVFLFPYTRLFFLPIRFSPLPSLFLPKHMLHFQETFWVPPPRGGLHAAFCLLTLGHTGVLFTSPKSPGHCSSTESLTCTEAIHL